MLFNYLKNKIMRAILSFALVAMIMPFAVAPVYAFDGAISLKSLKSMLKQDSSEAGNAKTAAEIIKWGVSFEYTMKREQELRKSGANDEVLTAINRSYADNSAEERIFGSFKENYASRDRTIRKSAYESGKSYLVKFETIPRFRENIDFVRAQMKYLECEFDASKGC